MKKGYRSTKPFMFRRKCECLLLSNEGKSMDELAEIFSVRRATVAEWFDRWENGGLKGLEMRAGRGRPKKLDTENIGQVKRIKELVENDPQNLNRVLVHIKSEYGIKDLSKKTLQRFLKNLNTDGNGFAK